MARLAGLLGLLSLVGGAGCGTAEEDVDASEDAVTATADTAVKNQGALGTCWIYSTIGWVESLVEDGSGYEAHYSESYLAYWDWFEKITAGRTTTAGNGQVWLASEGGWWGRAAELIRRYGLMKDGGLFPGVAPGDIQKKQLAARAAMTAELTSGTLRTSAARQNPATVRAALDRAWGHDASGIGAHLERVFGRGAVTTRIDTSYRVGRLPGGVPMWRAADIAIKVVDPDTGKRIPATLADAIGEPQGSDWLHRQGPLAWTYVEMPRDAAGQRVFFRRMQRALADGVSLPVVWSVPIDAMKPKLIGPGSDGRYGLHATLISDYEAMNVPGFGTLPAGQPSSAAARTAALADATKMKFLRVKNSWGGGSSIVPNDWWPPGGYNDLYGSFLTSPVQGCQGRDPQHLEGCRTILPLHGIAFPPAR